MLVMWSCFLDARAARDRRRQLLQQRGAIVPDDTRVGDALAVDELFAGHQILPAGIQMTLHMTPKMRSSRRNLAGDIVATSI